MNEEEKERKSKSMIFLRTPFTLQKIFAKEKSCIFNLLKMEREDHLKKVFG